MSKMSILEMAKGIRYALESVGIDVIKLIWKIKLYI